MPESTPAEAFRLPSAVVAVAPFLDPRTWGAVAYLWLGFPLGLVWFVGMTVGFLTGAALTIVWVGLIVLAVTLFGVWGAEGLERWLAILLLGARVPARRDRAAGPETAGAWIRSVVGGAALWKGTLFLALRFWLGLVCWVFSIVTLAVSLAFLAAQPEAVPTADAEEDEFVPVLHRWLGPLAEPLEETLIRAGAIRAAGLRR